jgi:TPR repeat protein
LAGGITNQASHLELPFMTLSQASHGQSLVAALFSNPANGARHDKATLAVCEKAAEQGLSTAQLALAQLYAARRAGPKDLVQAYMWFLIANEHVSQAKNHVNQSMTMEQLLEAEQRAAEWMRKAKKVPPSSIENPPNASTA